MRTPALVVLLVTFAGCGPQESTTDVPTERSARTQPETAMGLYTPDQHELYNGEFNIVGRSIYQVGGLNDPSPWDHMGDNASNVRRVGGQVTIDVNEIENSGAFAAQILLPAGTYRIELKRFNEFSPCQDGGIAAYLFEHGNAGCGDSNWPKSLLYVAGWGYGTATLDGETLYEDYEIHFMVTQGMRDRRTLAVQLSPESGEAGSINPATQQIDFYIRSPERNEANHPNREVFDHFFAMEVTWK